MRFHHTVTAAAAVLTLTATSSRDAAAQAPSPDATPPAAQTPPAPETVTREKPILGLLISGPIVLGVSYLSTLAVSGALAATSTSPRAGKNFAYTAIPLVGPLVLLADPDKKTGDFAAPLVIASIVQTGGLVMTILGATLTTKETVPAAGLGEGRTLSVTPGVAQSDAEGATLTLAF